MSNSRHIRNLSSGAEVQLFLNLLFQSSLQGLYLLPLHLQNLTNDPFFSFFAFLFHRHLGVLWVLSRLSALNVIDLL